MKERNYSVLVKWFETGESERALGNKRLKENNFVETSSSMRRKMTPFAFNRQLLEWFDNSRSLGSRLLELTKRTVVRQVFKEVSHLKSIFRLFVTTEKYVSSSPTLMNFLWILQLHQ